MKPAGRQIAPLGLMASPHVTFGQLLERFRLELVQRLNNGEFTERALARRAGISQPQLHNMLKGVRTFTPQMADRILKALRLSVRDLIEG
ncbi:MAG: helix-turn-helix transcriptional regulator [Acidobacteriaceae bacterium]|nr:helix-turn-helix transcriptional regulator [Acidobacteriaceae bacterium]